MYLILKIAWRNLKKSKIATSINLIGIAVGLFTSILLLTYVKMQFKTDAYLENYERIYRVERNQKGIWLPYKAVETIKENVPDIEQITCFHKSFSTDNILSYGENNYKLNDVILADPDFFKVFKHQATYGALTNCLENPNSIVLCKSEAQKIFGNIDPVGETIKYTTTGYRGGEFIFTVTAVIDDPPGNSSIRFKNIISQAFSREDQEEYQSSRNWNSSNFITYVLLNKNANTEQVTHTIQTTIKNFRPADSNENYETYRLNPLKGIYFDKLHYWAVTQNTGKKSIVIILGVVAVLILLIAGINYFNLVLAQSKSRLKTIGTSKIIGAGRFYIVSQSIIESIIILIVSLFLAALLTTAFIPGFNNLLNQSFEIREIFSFKNSGFIILILSSVIILFGLLPSFSVMRQNAVNSIKGDFNKKGSGNNLKYGLVIFQFVITIGLISSLLIMHKQNQFLLKSDYGIDKDHIYCIRLNPSIKDKTDYLKQEFLKNPHVRNIAFGFDHFGDFAQGGTALLNTSREEKIVEYSEFQVYGDFIDVFNLNLLNGRDFDKTSVDDNEIIVNKAFIDKYINIDIPGSSLTTIYNKKESKIIGVVDDFNFKSKHFPIEPIIFKYNKYWSNVMFINLTTTSIAETQSILSSFQKTWDKTIDIFPFEGEFLSDHYNNIYKSETNFMKLIFSFSILSIFLGCLGLFGISLYLNQLRTKEIGIRKVNGARISEILILLNKDFIKWVAIAFIIATPVAYFAMQKWLENFAYKTTLSWWIFALAGVLALGIALLTVSFQSWKAAIKNPVESLRYE